jgi:hypothetical protein
VTVEKRGASVGVTVCRLGRKELGGFIMIGAKDLERLRKLHALMGSSNAGERESAWEAIDNLLRKHRRTWNDMPELLAQPAQAAAEDNESPSASPPNGNALNTLDLVRSCLEDYVALKPHEYVAVTLWVHHAHVVERSMISPRLLLMSPVRGCGKTTALDLIGRLVPGPMRSDSATPAAIYRWIDSVHPTILLDEVDNLGLALRTNGELRAVLNSGHRRGGTIDRVIDGAVRHFSTFAPVALAAIGLVPMPLMHTHSGSSVPARRRTAGGILAGVYPMLESL